MSDRSPYEILGVPEDVDDDGVRRAFRKIARATHPDLVGDDPVLAARFQEALEAAKVLVDPDLRAEWHARQAPARPARPSRRREDREAFFSAMMRRAARGDGPDKGDPFESMFVDADAQPRSAPTWDPTDPFAEPQPAAEPAPEPVVAAGGPVDAVVDVSVPEAMLGAWIELDTPAGPTRVVLLPASSSGTRVVAAGRGPQSSSGARADWTVEVRIVVPPHLDERTRELVRELAGRLPQIER